MLVQPGAGPVAPADSSKSPGPLHPDARVRNDGSRPCAQRARIDPVAERYRSYRKSGPCGPKERLGISLTAGSLFLFHRGT